MKEQTSIGKPLSVAVGEYLSQYAGATEHNYRRCLEPMVAALGESLPVGEVETAHLNAFIKSVRDRPTVNSPYTVNNFIRAMKGFFNWCVDVGYIDRSPAKPVKRLREKKRIDDEKVMTESEFQRLLDYTKSRPRDDALLRFIADTGCRAGGAAGLRVRDLNLDEMTAVVTEKGDKTRVVWYDRACADALRRWLDTQDKQPDDLAFAKRGASLDNASVAQIIRRACKTIGIRSLGSHSLRHRKGRQLSDAGVSPTVAATVLGHDNSQTTQDYYYPRDHERAARAARQVARKDHDPDVSPRVRKSPENLQKDDPDGKIVRVDFKAG
ncbi:MAG: tyrosine-type recombinase/integrase [Chloroflexota bacterium]